MQDYQVIGVGPDISEERFFRILLDAGSPAAAAATAVYRYCVRRRVSPAFLLAMFQIESRFGLQGTATQTHSWGNTRSPSFGGVPEMGTVPGRSGVFPVFANWADGGISTAARFLDHAPYAGKTTVAQIIPVWAPKTDQNDPAVYIAAVLASIESWVGKGAPPVVVLQPPPMDKSHQSPNKNGYAGKRRVDAVVWHVTAGSFSSSLGWLTNPASSASANYLLDKDGSIYDLVPPDQDAWANGAVNKPDTSNPLIPKWQAEGVNFNQRTVSIETARESSANEQPGGFTEAQHKTLVRLTAWLCQTYHLTPDRTHIFGHRTIDSVNRPHCPGLAESEWDAWVGEIAALVGGTTPPAPPSAMQEPVVIPATDFGGKGRVVAIEVTVENTEEHKFYSRKKTGDVLEDWREV